MRYFTILLGALFLLVVPASAAPPPRLLSLGITNNQFRVELRAEAGVKVFFEASSNLVEWFQLQEVLPAQAVTVLTDPASTGARQRFYRIRGTQLSLLRPTTLNLFAGDQELFFVEDGSSSTNWVWSVNGIVGGNATVGTVLKSPAAPWLAAYKAPLSGGAQVVQLCAMDPAVPGQSHCTTIKIYPRPTTYVLQPQNPTMGMAEQVSFSAGAVVEGVGFVALRHIYWKVNAALAGNAQVGVVDFDGKYTSPLAMPTNLPQAIRVGFSFTAPGPVEVDTSVRLARLIVQPSVLDSITIGKAGTLVASLLYSDGTKAVLPTNQVKFTSSLPFSALLNPGGDVILGQRIGRAVIMVEHPPLKLTTVASAYARPDVRLEIHDVDVPTGDGVRIKRTGTSSTLPITEIEVTRPGAILKIAPDIFQFRGTFNSTASHLQVAGSPFVKARGVGANFVTFNRTNGMIQPTGKTAIVEESSGVIQIGDASGSGTVVFTYDDGVIKRETSVLIIYSRPEIRATTRSANSFGTNVSYVSEPITFTVKLTNQWNASKYVARTPLRIRETSDAPFHAVLRVSGPSYSQFNATKEVNIDVPSTLRDPFSAENYSPWLVPGQIDFQLWPDAAGRYEFEIAMANDPFAPTQKVVYNVKRPSLRLPLNPANRLTQFFSPARTNTLLGSWENFETGTNEPVGVDLLTPSRLGTGEALSWSLRTPDGAVAEFPFEAALSGWRPWFRSPWRNAGPHSIWLHSVTRPEVRTEEFGFMVNGPTGGGLYDSISSLVFKPATSGVTPANRLAALRIIAPLETVWIPGVPVDIVLQTIDAAGVPRRVGKVSVTEERFTAEPDKVVRTTNSAELAGCSIVVSATVGGLVLEDVTAGAVISRVALADQDGRIHVRLTVPATAGASANGDIVVAFTPVTQFQPAASLKQAGDLPVELIRRLNGSLVSQDIIPIEVASVQNLKDQALQAPALLLGGRGLIINPPTLMLPTDRVRIGVAEGWLPADSEALVADIRGTTGWSASLASGLPAADFGPGLRLLRQSIKNGTLTVRLSADAAYFAGTAGSLGARDVALTFPDGSRWQTRIAVEKYSIERRGNQADHNLPLNAAYGIYESRSSVGRYPDGTVAFKVQSTDTTGAGARLDLELHPSINACWDANQNGITDPDEDRNHDGLFNEADDAGGVPFRGLMPINPVVGFRRDIDPKSGAMRVRELGYSLLSPIDAEFTIYGDLTDRRRLDESGSRFTEGYDPDLLPDFVSRSANGEVLLAWAGPTLVDAIRFTAYNFITKPRPLSGDPGLDLDQVRTNMAKAYDVYGRLNPEQPLAVLARGPKVSNPVSVYVDQEATLDNLLELRQDPDGYFDVKFYAGMLDQLFQLTYVRTSAGFRDVPLVRDDRVRAYSPRGRPETGSVRSYFGLDLDGVVYDPGSLNFPLPRWVDLSELEVPPGQILDKNPNTPELLAAPTVRNILGNDLTPTASGLIRRVGGTSGGFVNLDAPHVGGLQVEAKTPGADFPGLHAGYLILGRPGDLVDGVTGMSEDDIRDVILKRDGEVGEAAGTPLVRERNSIGFARQRFVEGFAQNEDKKDSIKTAARVNTKYQVTTDPAGVTPDNPATWRVSPGILTRERPSLRSQPFDMVVTSQSDGNEALMKLVTDAVVDFTVDIAANALLASVTGGLSLECEFDGVRETLKAAVIDLSINAASSELLKTYTADGRESMVEFGNSVTRSGFEVSYDGVAIPGVSIPGYSSLTEPLLLTNLVKGLEVVVTNKFRPKWKSGTEVLKDSFPDICAVINFPVDQLKDSIKNSYSAETFGGLGSAQALGTKLAAVTIPRSARIGTNGGIYTVNLSVSRRVDVQPEEPTAVSLGDLPYQGIFTNYPYCDLVSDDEFLRILQEKVSDPKQGENAAQILRDIGRKSVWRVSSDAPYRHYKMRCWNVPELGGLIAPGMQMNDQNIGRFALTPGATEIPVSTAALVVIGRSNENSTSRARVRTPGMELILVGGVIPDLRAPH